MKGEIFTVSRYRSAIDWWLILLFPILLLADAFFEAGAITLSTKHFFGILAALLIGGGMGWILCWPCEYTLHPDHLEIHCGKLLHKHIRYKDITAISKSVNPISAPALSLRRVKVSYGNSAVLISPRRRNEFILALKQRCKMINSDAQANLNQPGENY